MNHKTKVVCMFGAPCAGKTVAAMELTAMLKKKGISAEYVSEVAKDIIHDETTVLYQHQDWISAEQNRRQRRLVGKYEYIVTDSPIMLSIFYLPPNYYPSFPQLVLEKHHSYDNINFYLNRVAAYDRTGRYQDEEGARELDLRLRGYLKNEGYPVTYLDSDSNAVHKMCLTILQDRTPVLTDRIHNDTNSY